MVIPVTVEENLTGSEKADYGNILCSGKLLPLWLCTAQARTNACNTH